MTSGAQEWYCPCCGGHILRLMDETVDVLAQVELPKQPPVRTTAGFEAAVQSAAERAMAARTAAIERVLRVAADVHRCPRLWQRLRFRWIVHRAVVSASPDVRL